MAHPRQSRPDIDLGFMAHIRRSRPNIDLGFQVKPFKPFQPFPFCSTAETSNLRPFRAGAVSSPPLPFPLLDPKSYTLNPDP